MRRGIQGLVGGWLVLVGLSVTAAAQVPVNPTTIAFDHVDFVGTDSYSVGYFTSEAAAKPAQEGTLTKPATCSPCSGGLPSRPTAFQSWWVAVRAVAGTVTSEWSQRVPFLRVQAAPTNVTLK